jgi:hypothetical protein
MDTSYTNGVLIKVNGKLEEYNPEAEQFNLEELQHAVGGYIEILSINEFLVVINEDGKSKGLPYNEIATKLMLGYLFDGDYIVGDALVCHQSKID